MKNKTLLIITHCFPQNEKDIPGNFIYDFCKELRTLGWEINIFTPLMDKEKINKNFTHKYVNNIYYFKWMGGKKRLSELNKQNPKDILSLTSFFLQGRKKLFQILLNNKPPMFILAAWAFPGGYFAYQAHKKFKIPYAVWALGSDINTYANYPIIKKIFPKIYEKSRFSFVNSYAMYNKVMNKFKKKSIMLFTNRIIDFSKNINFDKEIFNLVYIARIEKVKGPDILIESINNANLKEPWHLDIIGDGSMRIELENIIRASHLSKNIQFHGILSKSQIAPILKKASYLIISSRSEGMPVVFWEAMQARVPVLATNVGDIKYYCQQFDVGRTVDVSSKELADLINFAQNFSPLRKVLSKNTSNLASLVSLKKSASTFTNLINNEITF